MNIIKITPNAMLEIRNELNQVNSDTKEIIRRYNEILNKLNFSWEGEVQTIFNNKIIDNLQHMERLTETCDQYSTFLSDTVNSYEACENTLAKNLFG